MILFDLQDLQLEKLDLGFAVIEHCVRFRQQLFVAALVVLRDRLNHIFGAVLHLHLYGQLLLQRLQVPVIGAWIVGGQLGAGVCRRR